MRASAVLASVSDAVNKLSDAGYCVIHFLDRDVKNKSYQIIAYNPKDVIGRGSYGVVYQGHPVNPQTGAVNFESRLAIKIFHQSEGINPKEAQFFNAHYGACELLHDSLNTYMVMKYLPGRSVMVNADKNKTSILNVELASLDFASRVDVVCNIMMAVNVIHHNKPNTGRAMIHGDLNGGNILVDIDKDNGIIDVYIIDFGTAEEVSADEQQLQPADMQGTPLYMANELIENERHGIKTDIYALTPVFASLLGADNPFALRKKVHYFKPEYYKIPYDFTGVLKSIQVPEYPFDIKTIIMRFLNRMQEVDSARRPDSDETLGFFVRLNKLCKLYANHGDEDDSMICLSNLIRISLNEEVDPDRQIEEARKIVKPYLFKKFDLRKDAEMRIYRTLIAKPEKHLDPHPHRFVELRRLKSKIKNRSMTLFSKSHAHDGDQPQSVRSRFKK